jgi:hypothetical protein
MTPQIQINVFAVEGALCALQLSAQDNSSAYKSQNLWYVPAVKGSEASLLQERGALKHSVVSS